MRIIALHGDFASASGLKRDCGFDSWEFIDWRRWHPFESHASIARRVAKQIGRGPFIGVGFSAGGSIMGHISQIHDGMSGFIGYESPLLGTDWVGGDFPVLWIENDEGRRFKGGRFGREMRATLDTWSQRHPMEIVLGSGTHTRKCSNWPWLRHGWDKGVNVVIEKWLSKVELHGYNGVSSYNVSLQCRRGV